MTIAILRKLGLAAGLAVTLSAGQGVEANASDRGDGLPPGSYLSSCRDANVGGRGNLRAECRDLGGSWIDTSLRLPCHGDIANRDGYLVCDGGKSGDLEPDFAVPEGPYRNYCGGARVNWRNVLVANCRRQDGQWVESRLQLPCYGSVDYSYARGNLVCDGREPDYRVPAPDVPDYAVPEGPYRNYCGGARVDRYNVLVANCRRDDGQWVESRLQLPCYGEVVFRRGRLRCGG